MALSTLRRAAVAVAILAGTMVAGVIPPASANDGDGGACLAYGDRVRTNDDDGNAPWDGWACMIDPEDNIMVCDNVSRAWSYVRGRIFSMEDGHWVLRAEEKDGPDNGCDQQHIGNPEHTSPETFRLTICSMSANDVAHNCGTIIFEDDE